MKKLAAFLLAVLMVCALFAGCGDGDKKDKDTAGDPSSFFGGDQTNKDSQSSGNQTPAGTDTKPEGSDTPDTPATPSDVPAVPDTPDVPAVPDTPDVPAVPDTPDVPAVPDTPDVPAVPDTPDVPVTPPDKPAFLDSSYQKGTVTGVQWASEWAQMEFICPAGWEIDPELIPVIDEPGTTIEVMAYDIMGSGECIYVYVVRCEKDEDDSLSYLSAYAKDSSPAMNKTEICGKQFDYFIAEKGDANRFYHTHMATKYDNCLIYIRIYTDTVAAAERLMGCFVPCDGASDAGSEPANPPSVTDTYERGYTEGSYWGSRWIGLEVTMANGFALASELELLELMLTGAGIMCEGATEAEMRELAAQLDVSFEMIASDVMGNNITVTVEKTPNTVTSELEYIETLKQQLNSTNPNIQFSDAYEEEFFGLPFIHMTWSASFMDITVIQQGLFRYTGDRMISILFSYIDEGRFEDMIVLFDAFDGVPNYFYGGLASNGTIIGNTWTSEEYGMSYTAPADFELIGPDELFGLPSYGTSGTAWELLVTAGDFNGMLISSVENPENDIASTLIDEYFIQLALQTDYVTLDEDGRGTEEICGITFEKAVFTVNEQNFNYSDCYYVACIGDRAVIINVSADDLSAADVLLSGFGK